MAAERVLVTIRRPEGPCGHIPSGTADSARSSNTTSQAGLVSFSQLTKRAAPDSAFPIGATSAAAAEACANPDRTAARPVAEIQTSESTIPERHSESAI